MRKKLHFKIVLFLTIIFIFSNCSKESNEVSYTVPVITTTSISNLNSISCLSGGSITSNGGDNITSKGLVWSTSPNPTLSDFHTSDATANTLFVSTINNLTPNTTYFVRAYATNSIGTAYGQEISFTTLTSNSLSNWLPSNLQIGVLAFYPFNSGSINDFSGNNYHLLNTTTASSNQDRNGNPNCAYNFVKSNNDYLVQPHPVFLNDIHNSQFSISLWFKTSGTRDGGDYEQLIGRGFGFQNCTYGEWSLGLHDCRTAVFSINAYQLFDTSSSGTTNCSTTLNDWNHIVITFDGNTRKLYKNGIQSTQSESSPCGSTATNWSDLFLGMEYTGSLDDVIIYNRVLTFTEINELYQLNTYCY